jgi:hypothetical protein
MNLEDVVNRLNALVVPEKVKLKQQKFGISQKFFGYLP